MGSTAKAAQDYFLKMKVQGLDKPLIMENCSVGI